MRLMQWVVLRIGRELLFFRRSLLGGEFIVRDDVRGIFSLSIIKCDITFTFGQWDNEDRLSGSAQNPFGNTS